ncbi:hypothetical protein BB559_002520 [Furculomyces boomerangus]|uniref:Uncharacterized protein n=1 Tax=Furculomyces boomerangus TaxID=61424 RepID=A0A2T9YUV0_9FUNG|nr:hypothetical protein BB559_002520 [Furculomyces boomerangus]
MIKTNNKRKRKESKSIQSSDWDPLNEFIVHENFGGNAKNIKENEILDSPKSNSSISRTPSKYNLRPKSTSNTPNKSPLGSNADFFNLQGDFMKEFAESELEDELYNLMNGYEEHSEYEYSNSGSESEKLPFSDRFVTPTKKSLNTNLDVNHLFPTFTSNLKSKNYKNTLDKQSPNLNNSESDSKINKNDSLPDISENKSNNLAEGIDTPNREQREVEKEPLDVDTVKKEPTYKIKEEEYDKTRISMYSEKNYMNGKIDYEFKLHPYYNSVLQMIKNGDGNDLFLKEKLNSAVYQANEYTCQKLFNTPKNLLDSKYIDSDFWPKPSMFQENGIEAYYYMACEGVLNRKVFLSNEYSDASFDQRSVFFQNALKGNRVPKHKQLFSNPKEIESRFVSKSDLNHINNISKNIEKYHMLKPLLKKYLKNIRMAHFNTKMNNYFDKFSQDLQDKETLDLIDNELEDKFTDIELSNSKNPKLSAIGKTLFPHDMKIIEKIQNVEKYENFQQEDREYFDFNDSSLQYIQRFTKMAARSLYYNHRNYLFLNKHSSVYDSKNNHQEKINSLVCYPNCFTNSQCDTPDHKSFEHDIVQDFACGLEGNISSEDVEIEEYYNEEIDEQAAKILQKRRLPIKRNSTGGFSSSEESEDNDIEEDTDWIVSDEDEKSFGQRDANIESLKKSIITSKAKKFGLEPPPLPKPKFFDIIDKSEKDLLKRAFERRNVQILDSRESVSRGIGLSTPLFSNPHVRTQFEHEAQRLKRMKYELKKPSTSNQQQSKFFGTSYADKLGPLQSEVLTNKVLQDMDKIMLPLRIADKKLLKYKRNYEKIDWIKILKACAVAGIPDKVISRSYDRLATLFLLNPEDIDKKIKLDN